MMNAKTAFITGVNGQDGGYLAALLLAQGYEVHGLARSGWPEQWERLRTLESRSRFRLHRGDLRDEELIRDILESTRPDEIYNLAAQSHIQRSFENPDETTDINVTGAVKLLDLIRRSGLIGKVRFYQASTSEIFGEGSDGPQSETSPIHPLNPYGVSKHAAFEAAANFREAFGLYVSNGILFNHESPYRGEQFVTRKIAKGAASWAQGTGQVLRLGNLDARRDWGHARDYVRGMWLMLQHSEPDDFVLATGVSHSVREFAEQAFLAAGRHISWEGEGVDEAGRDVRTGELLIEVSAEFFRPIDISKARGDAGKARRLLGWEPKTSFAELVQEMVEADIHRLENPGLGHVFENKF